MWTQINKLTDLDRAQLEAGIAPLARKLSVDDVRTPAQRNLEALITLAQRGCDAADLPTVAAQRPHLLLVRTQDDRGADTEPAHLDGVGPVSTATADLTACDADATVITKDAGGRIWDVGHSDGNPSRKQRLAVIARDKVCVGCGAPAVRCQIHHIRWRRNGGGTYIANLALVCWSCHQGIHHRDSRNATGRTTRRPAP